MKAPKPDLKMEIHDNHVNNEKVFAFRIAQTAYMTEFVVDEMVREMAKQLAAVYIKDHFKEIMERVSPEAIANIAIAEAGAKINETLSKKLPDRVDTIRETDVEVYERGFFGGVKRVR